jgi:hypothetical protein
MTRSSSSSFSLLGAALSFLFLTACFHTSTTLIPKKPHDFCFCGSMTDLDNKTYCAVWGERKRFDTPHKAFAAQAQATCTAADCSKLFSSQCAAMQMSAQPPVEFPKPVAEACFCDSSLIENDIGQITLVCAAWIDGSKELLEYYATKECKVDTCKSAPFVNAPKICPAGFKSFYDRSKALTPSPNG